MNFREYLIANHNNVYSSLSGADKESVLALMTIAWNAALEEVWSIVDSMDTPVPEYKLKQLAQLILNLKK